MAAISDRGGAAAGAASGRRHGARRRRQLAAQWGGWVGADSCMQAFAFELQPLQTFLKRCWQSVQLSLAAMAEGHAWECAAANGAPTAST